MCSAAPALFPNRCRRRAASGSTHVQSEWTRDERRREDRAALSGEAKGGSGRGRGPRRSIEGVGGREGMHAVATPALAA